MTFAAPRRGWQRLGSDENLDKSQVVAETEKVDELEEIEDAADVCVGLPT